MLSFNHTSPPYTALCYRMDDPIMISNLLNGLIGLPVEEFYSFSSSSTRNAQWKRQVSRPRSNIGSAFVTELARNFWSCQETYYQASLYEHKDLSIATFRACLTSLLPSIPHRVFSYLLLPSLGALISLFVLLHGFS